MNKKILKFPKIHLVIHEEAKEFLTIEECQKIVKDVGADILAIRQAKNYEKANEILKTKVWEALTAKKTESSMTEDAEESSIDLQSQEITD